MKRILVVDDMPIFREPIAASLRREGYETVCASNGKEALQEVERQRPDLILLDLAMPVMDGIACLKVLRQNPANKDIPVLILSALSEREAVTEAARLGVQGYLLKSQFSLGDLLARVREKAPNTQTTPPQQAPAPQASSHPQSTKEAPPPQKLQPPAKLTKEETLERAQRGVQLRAVPAVLQHVLSLTRSRSSCVEEVGNAIRQDHALSLKVMKVANSSFFGSGKKAQNVTEATQRLGMAGVRNAVMAILTIEQFSDADVGGLIPQRFWEHSLATAVLADLAGQMIEARDVDHLFLAGLLHDIGRLVLSSTFPTEYEWIVRTAAMGGEGLLNLERQVFGLSHDQLSPVVLRQWETPDQIIDAVASHEITPKQLLHSGSAGQPALIVGLANRLAHAMLIGDSGDPVLLPCKEHARAIGLTEEAVCDLAREGLQKTQDTEVFYAAQVMQRLREPLSKELASRCPASIELKVLAPKDDPLQFFADRLGWLSGRQPKAAILSVQDDRDLGRRLTEFLDLEHRVGRRLGVLVASPTGSLAPSPALLDRRSCATFKVPERYEVITQTVTNVLAGVAKATTVAV